MAAKQLVVVREKYADLVIAGWNFGQIARLIRLRHKVKKENPEFFTMDVKRLIFAGRLAKAGKISG